MSQLIPTDWPLYARYLAAFFLLSARYFIFAGIAYLAFYVWKKREWFFRKIQQKFPERKQITTEMKYSISTFAIFALMIVFTGYLRKHGYVKPHPSLQESGTAYFLFASAFLIFFHDTYFYWAHRLMHVPFFYKHVHSVHHLSKDPTPWAAFAFHPFEAFIEIGFLPILLFIIPAPKLSYLILSFWMILFNVMGHLGYEIFPRNFFKIPLVRWFNTSTNHNMHHKYVSCNYGLYFNIWDSIMGTNHKKYRETFAEVTSRSNAADEPELTNELAESISSKVKVSA
jgi:lathosterol oxidase